ncbi:RNA polymerase beta subunit rpoB (apicoplast) [Theileria orientalis]|uniref:DNA-directed RNA polymerase subunit beta n=1 Tax=Theileria orientalis TaxID=68886 RepID=A0A976XJH2_THEOR|nr:RNA polymerase beta subunit rpoB [Theileria orientalis]
MYKSDNSVYTNYIDSFLNNLYNLFNYNINYDINNYYGLYSLTNLKPYLNFLTLNPNNLEDNPNNQYLNYNYNSYYTVNIPLKINFNNCGHLYVNYNIINIPKLIQSGDVMLNGYFRIPILYLKLAVKNLFFTFGNNNIYQYLIKLNYNFKLYIYNCDNTIHLYLNSYKICNNLFNIYNTIILKNKYINFITLTNILYLLNLKKIKKYKIFNSLFIFNKFLSNLYIEIFNIFNKLINIKFNKKFMSNNDNLVYKFSDSILDSILKTPRNDTISISNIIKLFIIGEKNENIENNSINTILFKENLLTNPLLHYTNQLNILSYLFDKSKINIFGYTNFSDNKFNISNSVRKIHNDYIGLINILNTSDGETCGLISVLSNNTIFDKYKLKLLSYSSNLLENFTYIDITSKNLNDIIINNFSHSKKNKVFKIKTVEVLENNEFKIVNFNKKLNDKTLHILNVLSITELVIPFLFNNDPCRSLMGSKMHTQALPLLYANNSYVVTNYNSVNNLLSSRFIYSMCDGVIQDVDNSRIIISDDKDRLIYHYLYPFNVVDYNSVLFYKPIVWEGEKVCVGKILAVPNDLKNLEFSIGFNNFVNYSFYDGYEHEDAIIINKDLIVEDILTSISFNVYEDCLYLKKYDCLELIVQKFFKDSGKKNIEEEEIDDYDFYYYKYFLSGEELFFKIKYEIYHYKSTYFNSLLSLLFPLEKILLTKNKGITIKHGGEGRLVKYEILSNYDLKQSNDFNDDLNISYMVLRFFIAKIDRINIGDKLCGRHGNKGVVSKISETIDLPYTFNDSIPYSITSPVGSLARINLGQFLEGVCGYKSLNYNCRTKAPINLFDSYLYSNLYFNILHSSYDFYTNSCLINTINENYLRDFKTGYKLKNFNLLSVPYYLKLMHTSKSKFNYRTIGRYSTVTQQPVEGKNAKGGQKFGEMEIWALEAHGSSYNIQELALLKTNIKLFKKFETTLVCSESFKVLTLELKNILINIDEVNNYKFCSNPKIINYIN